MSRVSGSPRSKPPCRLPNWSGNTSVMKAAVSCSTVTETVTLVPVGLVGSTVTGPEVRTQVVGLLSSHSALPTVVRAPPDGKAPAPMPLPGGAGANGLLGQALTVYVMVRPPPAGSMISGVTVIGGLLATTGIDGSDRSASRITSDGATSTVRM